MYMIIYIQALITIQILYQLKAYALLHKKKIIIIIAIWPYVNSKLDWGSTSTIHTAILQLITISM